MKVTRICFERQYFLLIIMAVILVHWLGVASFCLAETTAKPASVSAEKPYLIGIGDILEVSVWQEPDISKNVFVRLDGRISLPLVGDVYAKGLAPEALARTITEKISKFIAAPSVTVTLKESKSKIYYVLGQIIRPGEYSLSYPVSILQAIARAGGFAEWAKKDKVIVVRKGADQETILRFNYDRFVDGKDLDQNLALQPGDTLIVP